MAAQILTALRQRLIDLRDTENAVRDSHGDTSDIVQRALARYLVVRSAGYLEAVRDDVADHFVQQKGSSEVVRRIRSHLRNGQGVTPGQLLDFTKSFDSEWAEELRMILEAQDNYLGSQLGALVAARKKIAHGDGDNVTASKALLWSATAQDIAKWLIRRFDPSLPSRSPVIPQSKHE